MTEHSLEPVKRTYVSDTVTDLLENFIIENEMREGDKLPSERELAKSLHVGTRTIREALQRLETRGMIDIVHGKGSYVANRNIESYARHLVDSFRFLHDDDRRLLVEITYVRQIIEAAAVEEAARHKDATVIRELTETLERLTDAKNKNDVDGYNEMDLKFHRILVEATDNTLLLALYDNLRGLLSRVFESTGHIAGALERSLPEHARIQRAVEGGDPNEARQALLDHIANTSRDIRKFLEKESASA